MSTTSLAFGWVPPKAPTRRFTLRLKSWSWLVLVALLMSICQAIAQDDAYLKIFNIIQEADTLAEKGATAPALAKYHEAQKELQSFRIEYPRWNVSVVSFRAKVRCRESCDPLSAAPCGR